MASSTCLILYFLLGNRPILSKQSLSSCSTSFFVNATAVGVGPPLTLSTLNATMPNSFACLHPNVALLPGALTTLKSATVGLSLYAIFINADPWFSMTPPPYFLSMHLFGLTSTARPDLCSSHSVMVHVSDPVSTLSFVLYVPLSITRAKILSDVTLVPHRLLRGHAVYRTNGLYGIERVTFLS